MSNEMKLYAEFVAAFDRWQVADSLTWADERSYGEILEMHILYAGMTDARNKLPRGGASLNMVDEVGECSRDQIAAMFPTIDQLG